MTQDARRSELVSLAAAIAAMRGWPADNGWVAASFSPESEAATLALEDRAVALLSLPDPLSAPLIEEIVATGSERLVHALRPEHGKIEWVPGESQFLSTRAPAGFLLALAESGLRFGPNHGNLVERALREPALRPLALDDRAHLLHPGSALRLRSETAAFGPDFAAQCLREAVRRDPHRANLAARNLIGYREASRAIARLCLLALAGAGPEESEGSRWSDGGLRAFVSDHASAHGRMALAEHLGTLERAYADLDRFEVKAMLLFGGWLDAAS